MWWLPKRYTMADIDQQVLGTENDSVVETGTDDTYVDVLSEYH